MNQQLVAEIAVGLTCLVACVADLRTRRIPNVLTFGAAAAALCFHLFTGGLPGLGLSAAGWLVGAAVFFPFFALGGLGAGDVKLVAALGAWLGPKAVLWTALYGAIAGGALAVVVALANGYLRKALSNLKYLAWYWRSVGVGPVPDVSLSGSRGPRLAYALPITAGAVAALWFR